MKQVVGKIFVLALTGALLVYSALRSLDFVQMTLPPDKQVLGFFALAALDGGLIIWLITFLYGSSGSWQRAVCMIMIAVDFLGCVGLFSADTLLRTGESGLTSTLSEQAIFGVLIGLSIVIAMNIGAAVVHTLTDPKVMEAQQREEALGKVRDMTHELNDKRSGQLAGRLAPGLADAEMAELEAEMNNLLEDKKRRTAAIRNRQPVVQTSEVPPAQLPSETAEVQRPPLLARRRTR
jgi:hypothetical protein